MATSASARASTGARSDATRSSSASVSGITTFPSAAIRSRTPMQSARATNGSGLGACRSYGSSLSIRPIAGMSSKPAVVSSSTRAPRRSSRAFVPTVVPSVTDATAAGSIPAASKQSKTA